jgi:hypothetical protein
MKTKFYFTIICFCVFKTVFAQITTPAVKANFGVDADLHANYFNGAASAGNDDWFKKASGNGIGIIDTTGAADIVANYTANPASKMYSFSKPMSVPAYSVVNNMLLLDALFYRDFHGDDSTTFASGSNKNGMSPANWSCPVSQNIPDKNDILDAFTHIRRAGPSVNDSLWMFGGISIENNTGNRYFDFELYQTDITYNRSTRTFTGYGAQAGHTSWLFDAAGNVIRAGDIIFSAEYSSSSLSSIEARIWVSQTTYSTVTPVNFNWGGQFDGANAGAAYGYASISPKTAGSFYTGLQCNAGISSGPFLLVHQDNSITSGYDARQFMEFSINLSKLGLDPGVFGNNPCAPPFKRMIIKSRASTSFTSELKDFILPFELFKYPQVDAFAFINYQCLVFHPRIIEVANPMPNSTYKWTTTNGVIIGPDTGISIWAGAPGMYKVTQQLNIQCPKYSEDSVEMIFSNLCVLNSNFINLTVERQQNTAILQWEMAGNNEIENYIAEQSFDGLAFLPVSETAAIKDNAVQDYSSRLILSNISSHVYYRVKAMGKNGSVLYSKTVSLTNNSFEGQGVFYPNPVLNGTAWFIKDMPADETADISIWNNNGRLLASGKLLLKKGMNNVKLPLLSNKPAGCYTVKIQTKNMVITGKLILIN